jgi:septal ring factor EnvC (AmiA/AmiB activator)
LAVPSYPDGDFFMKKQLEQRLKELRAEFESGQKALNELENKQMNLRDTLLRISDAIKVLEEELSKENFKEEKHK